MNVRAALQSLAENWQRAALSGVGVMVAAVAILLLVAIGRGVEKDIRTQVEDLGANVLVVVPGRVTGMSFNPNLAGQSYLSEDDARRLRAVQGVRRVATLSFVGGGISTAQGKAPSAYPLIIATTPEWFEMRPVPLQEGQTFSAQREAVAVLGSVAASELFGESGAVGKTVEINGAPYRVVGVTESEKQSSSLFQMQSFENVVYIPYARHADQPGAQIDRFMIQSRPDVEPRSLVESLESALDERLDRQQFSVLTQEDLLGLIFRVMGILQWLLVGLTSIGLFVGGVGVMTVMLMAVNERRREIGVRKAMGARRRDIFVQFLVEATLIALSGMAAGLLLSWIVCVLLERLTPIHPDLSLSVIGLAFGVGIGLGVVFGLLPAVRASGQDPVVSLRNE